CTYFLYRRRNKQRLREQPVPRARTELPPATGVYRVGEGFMQKRAFILACAVALLAGYVFSGPRLIRQVKPVYPAEAKQAGVTGTARLEATIAPDGSVQNVRAASGHALLVPQAIEAVRQWQYEPVLLDGKPVAVMTTIPLNFTLPDALASESRPGTG